MVARHPGQSEFVQRLGDPRQLTELFSRLPGVCFFAKDREGRIMMGNQLFVEHCGFSSEDEIIGKNDYQIFPADLAQAYIDDDRAVMEQDKAITDRVELFPNHLGVPEWFITNKIPLHAASGDVIGVCGTTQSFERSRSALQNYLDIETVVDYIQDNLGGEIRVADLARRAKMSLRQLERKFHETFQTTPQQYIMQMRIRAACEELSRTNLSITEVALKYGFYDHSSFTHQFSRRVGVTPLKYRRSRLAEKKKRHGGLLAAHAVGDDTDLGDADLD